MPIWYFACLRPAPVAMISPKTTPKTCDQTENKQVLSCNRTKDWAVYELKHGQMMARVVGNLFGREGALLLQPCLHVHHLWVDGAQVGDVGLVSIRSEPTDHMAKLSNHVGKD